MHEGEGGFEVALTEGWTVNDDWVASCASTLDDGRLVVDLAFLHTPHRMEFELDPAASTFVARWPLVPLFGGGIGTRLTSFHPPD